MNRATKNTHLSVVVDDAGHDTAGHDTKQMAAAGRAGLPVGQGGTTTRRVPRRILTAADEVRLSRLIERGDRKAKDEMIEANLRLVYAIASRYRGLGVAFDDLVQEGTIGLVRAVDRFDHRRGLKVSTYAVWWIRRALIDAVGQARTIRIPAQAGRAIAALEHAETELRRDAGAAPTTEAVAERTGMSVRRLRSLRSAARVTVSLDASIGEDGTSLVELVADPHPVDPWRNLDEHETRRKVSSMLATLPLRQREVLIRRYGLRGCRVQPHAEIAACLGVGEERSRQLEREALHRLRQLDSDHLRAA